MAKKNNVIRAVEQDCDTITATCPLCATKHVYKETEYRVYNLTMYSMSKSHAQGVEDDRFVVSSGPPDYLWPTFVCRNTNCEYEGKVTVK